MLVLFWHLPSTWGMSLLIPLPIKMPRVLPELPQVSLAPMNPPLIVNVLISLSSRLQIISKGSLGCAAREFFGTQFPTKIFLYSHSSLRPVWKKAIWCAMPSERRPMLSVLETQTTFRLHCFQEKPLRILAQDIRDPSPLLPWLQRNRVIQLQRQRHPRTGRTGGRLERRIPGCGERRALTQAGPGAPGKTGPLLNTDGFLLPSSLLKTLYFSTSCFSPEQKVSVSPTASPEAPKDLLRCVASTICEIKASLMPWKKRATPSFVKKGLRNNKESSIGWRDIQAQCFLESLPAMRTANEVGSMAAQLRKPFPGVLDAPEGPVPCQSHKSWAVCTCGL